VVLDATDALTNNMHVTVQLQWLPTLMDRMPDKLVEAMVGPGLAKFNELKRVSLLIRQFSSSDHVTALHPQNQRSHEDAR
jgi:hypothetical protein